MHSHKFVDAIWTVSKCEAGRLFNIQRTLTLFNIRFSNAGFCVYRDSKINQTLINYIGRSMNIDAARALWTERVTVQTAKHLHENASSTITSRTHCVDTHTHANEHTTSPQLPAARGTGFGLNTGWSSTDDNTIICAEKLWNHVFFTGYSDYIR